MPCTDWFISFTHLGGGDGARAIAAAPILLIVQLIMLPVYIWLFMGNIAIELAIASHLLPAFFGLIVTPLILAWITERLTEKHPRAQTLVDWLGWLPVPLLALVVFLIAGSQVSLVIDNGALLWSALVVLCFTWLPPPLSAKGSSELFGFTPALSAAPSPSALVPATPSSCCRWRLSLPEPGVSPSLSLFQSLVELFGMVAYLRWLPRLIRHSD